MQLQLMANIAHWGSSTHSRSK